MHARCVHAWCVHSRFVLVLVLVLSQVRFSIPPQVHFAIPPQVRFTIPPQVRFAIPPQVRFAIPPQVRFSIPPQVQVQVHLHFEYAERQRQVKKWWFSLPSIAEQMSLPCESFVASLRRVRVLGLLFVVVVGAG